MKSKTITTKTPEATEKLGEKLGRLLKGGELVELSGDLGAGKTVFIKGLAKGLGIKQAISSPTFTINRIYEAGPLRFYHFDFYRIDLKDIVAFEIAEAAADRDGVTAVEWAENVAGALPDEHLTVSVKAADQTHREIVFTANGSKYQTLISKL